MTSVILHNPIKLKLIGLPEKKPEKPVEVVAKKKRQPRRNNDAVITQPISNPGEVTLDIIKKCAESFNQIGGISDAINDVSANNDVIIKQEVDPEATPVEFSQDSSWTLSDAEAYQREMQAYQ